MPKKLKAKTTEPRLRATFKRTKATKGTFVYSECDDDGDLIGKGEPVIVGSLYIKKDAAAKLGNPDSIRVIIKKAG